MSRSPYRTPASHSPRSPEDTRASLNEHRYVLYCTSPFIRAHASQPTVRTRPHQPTPVSRRSDEVENRANGAISRRVCTRPLVSRPASVRVQQSRPKHAHHDIPDLRKCRASRGDIVRHPPTQVPPSAARAQTDSVQTHPTLRTPTYAFALVGDVLKDRPIRRVPAARPTFTGSTVPVPRRTAAPTLAGSPVGRSDLARRAFAPSGTVSQSLVSWRRPAKSAKSTVRRCSPQATGRRLSRIASLTRRRLGDDVLPSTRPASESNDAFGACACGRVRVRVRPATRHLPACPAVQHTGLCAQSSGRRLERDYHGQHGRRRKHTDEARPRRTRVRARGSRRVQRRTPRSPQQSGIEDAVVQGRKREARRVQT
ncbi:hypothetical protein OH76DRAFT_1401505 [Lentinus brumalis]|uniref:Uncharacterized protein n=1 Tax=Lentinus brumalis TaxID=2498619 RepID=A0A371DF93_9APHY|nr:hypothetical protein OH76DRAFT_1401505 [Polyporus brumalis]